MELRVINMSNNALGGLGDGYFLVTGEIWRVNSNEGDEMIFELECIKGINIGMFQEFTRGEIADLFEVV